MSILTQLRSYSTPSDLRGIAVQQSAALRSAVRGGSHPRQATSTAAAPGTIAELNAALGKLPAARYALARKDGGVDFLELRRIGPGRYLVVRLLGAPGDFRRVTMSLRLQALASMHIAEDPAGAAKRFADLAGECARCGSPLTNEASRSVGLGPTCRRQFGI